MSHPSFSHEIPLLVDTTLTLSSIGGYGHRQLQVRGHQESNFHISSYHMGTAKFRSGIGNEKLEISLVLLQKAVSACQGYCRLGSISILFSLWTLTSGMLSDVWHST